MLASADCSPGPSVDQTSAGTASVAVPMDLVAEGPIVYEVQHAMDASGTHQADENLDDANCEYTGGVGGGSTAGVQKDLGESKIAEI
eukprot:5622395-Pleurochrysis_carterae.AAC.3